MLEQRAVGVFTNYDVTETALNELKNRGFLMDRVSVVGRDINLHTEMAGANTSDQLANIDNLTTDENEAEETAQKGAVAGSTLGGMTGLLVGLGIIAIPGIGPIMLAGATATAIATVISGGVIGAAVGSLAGGLVGLGIPNDRAKVYSDRITAGDYLVIVEGSDADITLAQAIFSHCGIDEWYAYELSSEPVQTVTTISAPTQVYKI
ncbi:MAG: DUF1269 domain-containing protein [Thermosynechococcaceae cyanobacterium]